MNEELIEAAGSEFAASKSGKAPLTTQPRGTTSTPIRLTDQEQTAVQIVLEQTEGAGCHEKDVASITGAMKRLTARSLPQDPRITGVSVQGQNSTSDNHLPERQLTPVTPEQKDINIIEANSPTEGDKSISRRKGDKADIRIVQKRNKVQKIIQDTTDVVSSQRQRQR